MVQDLTLPPVTLPPVACRCAAPKKPGRKDSTARSEPVPGPAARWGLGMRGSYGVVTLTVFEYGEFPPLPLAVTRYRYVVARATPASVYDL